MGRWAIFLCIIIVSWCVTGVSNATLIDNMDGTVTQIRTDGSRLMWVKDASLSLSLNYDNDGRMTWTPSMQWANQLDYAGHDDWRLPSAGPNPTDGFLPVGELGYLYYSELMNPAGGPMSNTGPFIQIISDNYWTNTTYSENSDYAWHFYLPNGRSGADYKDYEFHLFGAWAVRDMDPVPEPASMLLLGAGLVGLAGLRKRVKKS